MTSGWKEQSGWDGEDAYSAVSSLGKTFLIHCVKTFFCASRNREAKLYTLSELGDTKKLCLAGLSTQPQSSEELMKEKNLSASLANGAKGSSTFACGWLNFQPEPELKVEYKLGNRLENHSVLIEKLLSSATQTTKSGANHSGVLLWAFIRGWWLWTRKSVQLEEKSCKMDSRSPGTSRCEFR